MHKTQININQKINIFLLLDYLIKINHSIKRNNYVANGTPKLRQGELPEIGASAEQSAPPDFSTSSDVEVVLLHPNPKRNKLSKYKSNESISRVK